MLKKLLEGLGLKSIEQRYLQYLSREELNFMHFRYYINSLLASEWRLLWSADSLCKQF